MSTACWHCRLSIGHSETAPPPPPLPPPFSAADKYVCIQSSILRCMRSGSFVSEGSPLFIRRDAFFECPEIAIRSILCQLTGASEDPELLSGRFLSLAARLASSVAGNPSFAEAQIVPLRLSVVLKHAQLMAETLVIHVGPQKGEECQDQQQFSIFLEEFGALTLDD